MEFYSRSENGTWRYWRGWWRGWSSPVSPRVMAASVCLDSLGIRERRCRERVLGYCAAGPELARAEIESILADIQK